MFNNVKLSYLDFYIKFHGGNECLIYWPDNLNCFDKE